MTHRRSFLFAGVLAGLVLVNHTVGAAEFSGQGKSVGAVSVTNVFPGDAPDHMIVLVSSKAEDTSEDALYGNVSVHHTEIQDISGSSGTAWGYRTSTHANGDQSFHKFEGTMSNLAPDGSSGDFKGSWEFTGGTGKYAGITGSGTYEGKMVNSVATYTWEGTHSK